MALAGLAGLGAAWLIPRGGAGPTIAPTPSPTRATALTAAEEPLSAVDPGVSFRTLDGVRIFLVRDGSAVVGFHGRATTARDGPIYWCPRTSIFEDSVASTGYDRAGKAVFGLATRDLERVQVIVAAGRVTIFPHVITPGRAVTGPLNLVYPDPCAANERVG